MKIGELSRRAGVSVQAIRFYERQRLLKKPPRTPAGYRIYSEQDLDAIRLITHGKRFGFTLNEIRQVLNLFAVPDETGRCRYGKGEHACVAEILRIGSAKLDYLERQIASLKLKRAELICALDELRVPRSKP